MQWLGGRGSGPGGDGEDPAAARARLEAEFERQERDQYLLESGQLPVAVQERLARIGDGAGRLAFTSDLAPDEAGLLRAVGLRPLSLVTGSCLYHVGTAYASAYADCEVPQLSNAYNRATALAVERLRQEAAALGADGVVGVRYRIVRHEWADRTVEVQLVGTAVRGPDRPAALRPESGGAAVGRGLPAGASAAARSAAEAGPGAGHGIAARGLASPARGGGPWLCDLSGQEWWALWRAGYEPAALAYGHCTWFVLTTVDDEWLRRNYQNAELGHASLALSQCRTRAAQHMRDIAREVGAVGVVGVHVSRRLDEVRLTGYGDNPVYEFEHHNLVLSMIGTAVRVRQGAPARVTATRLTLPLRPGPEESKVGRAEAAFE